MSGKSDSNAAIESLINDYISRELVTDPSVLPLRNDSALLEPHIIDSLSLLKLVLFLEKEFGITVEQEELIPKNFSTVEIISSYIQKKKTS
ncbi:MAG: acyl carrier protein [Nitrososphaerales archaeon]